MPDPAAIDPASPEPHTTDEHYVGRCVACALRYRKTEDDLCADRPGVARPLPSAVTAFCRACQGPVLLTRVTLDTPTSDVPATTVRCPECARDHAPELPHDLHSETYQYGFYRRVAATEGAARWPTWHDAAAHCTPEIRAAWMAAVQQVSAGTLDA